MYMYMLGSITEMYFSVYLDFYTIHQHTPLGSFTPLCQFIPTIKGSVLTHVLLLLYSWKIWQGIKFGGLALHMYNHQITYVWRSLTEPPNLNCQDFCNGDFLFLPIFHAAIQYVQK